jgi:acetyl-CoA carboxylase carboxyltransferase component
MDKLKKFELMEKITNELTDLKHSQTAVIQKIGKIEVDNMELNDKKLTSKLPDMHQKVADILDDITEILESFDELKNNFEEKNNIEGLKAQEAINSLK